MHPADSFRSNGREIGEDIIKALLVYQPESLYTLNTNDCLVESVDHRSANPYYSDDNFVIHVIYSFLFTPLVSC